jgi:D-sedoheptulose 7-phosphate isomerase
MSDSTHADSAQSDWMRAQLDDHLNAGRAAGELLPAMRVVAKRLCEAFAGGHVLYTFGNGGSAADAQHLTGEIIGHYKRDRRPLPAVTLSTDPTTMTCIANDYAYADVFSRQVEALARPGDMVAAFSTSGSSPNIVSALQAAQANGATTVLFGGGDGGQSRRFSDYLLLSPSSVTARIQELHTFMLHVVSEYVDAWAAGDEEYA